MTHRALLTEREREVLKGETDVDQNYFYQVRYRVRQKITRLKADVDLLMTHQPELAREVYEAVAEPSNLD